MRIIATLVMVSNIVFSQMTCSESSPITITFADGQQRSIKKECIEFSQTLKEMQADQGSSELYVSSVVTPQIWDTIVAPTLMDLAGFIKVFEFQKPISKSLRSSIGTFFDQEDEAMIEAANVLHFLAVENVLQYHTFWPLATWYRNSLSKEDDPSGIYKRYCDKLTPGLAEHIWESRPWRSDD